MTAWQVIFVGTMAAFGLAYIVGHAKISLGARTAVAKRGALGLWLVQLLECPACFGFWTGVVAGAVLWRAGLLAAGEASLLPPAITATNFMLGTLTGLIDKDSE